jgi:hypothetical protein
MIGLIYTGFRAAMAACAYLLHSFSNAQWLKYRVSFSLPRFHGVCSECSFRRVRSGWELCSIWVVGYYARHSLRFNRKSTVTCGILCIKAFTPFHFVLLFTTRR